MLTLEQEFEAYSAYVNACSFYELACTTVTVTQLPDGTELPNVTTPGIVNGIFSLELFLKAIAMLETTQVGHTHKPLSIYKKISPISQSEILRYSGASASSPQELEAKLEKLAHTFVEWRYSHENKTIVKISIKDLFVLSTAANTTCYALFSPALKSTINHTVSVQAVPPAIQRIILSGAKDLTTSLHTISMGI